MLALLLNIGPLHLSIEWGGVIEEGEDFDEEGVLDEAPALVSVGVFSDCEVDALLEELEDEDLEP